MKLLLNVYFIILVCFLASCSLAGGGGSDGDAAATPASGTVEEVQESGTVSNEADAAKPSAPGSKTLTVRFQKGSTSRGYADSVSPGGKNTYVLGGSKGQLMKVTVSSPENNAFFTVMDPVGNKLSDGEPGNTVFEKPLPADGNYKIVVTSQKSEAKYKVGFAVTGGKSVDKEDDSAEAVGGLATTVKFAKGKSSVTYEDAVIRGERNRYVLGAKAGQTMNVNITSLEDNAVFQIRGPSGYLPGTEPGKDTKRWSGKLPANGNYTVIVGGTRGNATYKVSFLIK